jgi:hypothetical protein
LAESESNEIGHPWRYPLACNLICAWMIRAGAGAGVMTRSLSFKGTVQLYWVFEQQLCFAGNACARIMTAYLRGEIGLFRLPVRPRHIEPRAIERRPENLSLLTIPRIISRRRISEAGRPPPCRQSEMPVHG